MTVGEVLLVYDKQCPFCDYYCSLVRLRESVGQLRLVDARVPSDVMQEITDKGLDIDQGMVLKVGDQLYYGADAVHALALLGTRSGWFNRLNYWVFSSAVAARALYPLLRSCRNLFLHFLGRSRINNLGSAGNHRF